MDIRNSETRKKYFECKKFIEEYDKAYDEACCTPRKKFSEEEREIIELREQINNMLATCKRLDWWIDSPWVSMINYRRGLIKELLKKKYNRL